MGLYQAGRGLLVGLFVVIAACSSGQTAEEAALADGVAGAMVADDAEGLFLIELSASESDCSGRGIAATLGVERLAALGISAPGYQWPPPDGLNDETGEALWDSISDCVTVEEGLQRMLRDLPNPERDCVVDGFVERDIGLWDFVVLSGKQPSVNLEQRAQAVLTGCVPETPQ